MTTDRRAEGTGRPEERETMAWKLIEVPDDDPEATLDDAELVSIHILMRNHHGPPSTDINVYYRAWMKLGNAIDRALHKVKS
jgi:hypothetical protein